MKQRKYAAAKGGAITAAKKAQHISLSYNLGRVGFSGSTQLVA